VDSPKVVIETAEKRGIFSTGYHTNQSALAPKGYLTGAEWDWTSIYTQYVKWLQEGKTLADGGIPHLVRGGFKDGFLKISPFGPAVSAESKKEAEAVKDKFMAGTMVIYKGEIKDNTGKVIIPAGKELPQQAIELESMNWLVQGVNGKV